MIDRVCALTLTLSLRWADRDDRRISARSGSYPCWNLFVSPRPRAVRRKDPFWDNVKRRSHALSCQCYPPILIVVVVSERRTSTLSLKFNSIASESRDSEKKGERESEIDVCLYTDISRREIGLLLLSMNDSSRHRSRRLISRSRLNMTYKQ